MLSVCIRVSVSLVWASLCLVVEVGPDHRDMASDAVDLKDPALLVRAEQNWLATATAFLSVEKGQKRAHKDENSKFFRKKALDWLMATNNSMLSSCGFSWSDFVPVTDFVPRCIVSSKAVCTCARGSFCLCLLDSALFQSFFGR